MDPICDKLDPIPTIGNPMTAPQHPFELYAIDSLFNDEQLAMRDAVRKFVDDRIKPHVGQWFPED